MHFPNLSHLPQSRETLSRFGGLNRTQRGAEGEFSRMENLTGDADPVLSTREKRGIYAAPASPQGLISRDEVCYVDGPDFVLGDTRVPMNLSVKPEHCPKQLVSMGAWVIILPDKQYINTADPTDFGPMEAEFTTTQSATISMCRPDGADFGAYHLGAEPPESPQNGDLWLDTSASPHTLRQFSSESAQWVQVLSTCLRIQSPGIGGPFAKLDAVTLSFPEGVLPELSGANLITDRGEDYILITGILPEAVTVEGPITVSRKLPVMDYVVEAGNRLWGCRYGTDEHGEFVNRIYASALGDFRNWNRFQGLSTDSYFANLGSEGPFTGAVNYLGEALFFKETCLHRVWGSYPSEFRVLHTPCPGVEPDSDGSLAVVGQTLYYKAHSGVCAYDGSQPRLISRKLGDRVYSHAVSGGWGSKLYICMDSPEGRELLVYDTDRGTWHREDDLNVVAFCSHRGSLYAIDGDACNILRLRGPGEVTEEDISWLAETCPMGLSDPDQKYLSRVVLRLALEPGGEVHLDARYDDAPRWEHLAVIHSTDLRSIAVPVLPRRCDHMQLRLRGRGHFKLYSITKTMEGGSDSQW